MQNSTRRRKRPEIELYEDAHGVRFCEIRSHLPARVKDWPKLRTVKDHEVIRIHKMFYQGTACPLCNGDYWACSRAETHHLVCGAARSDEFCNLIELCSDCHAEVQSDPKQTARVWLAKWTVDKQHCDWRRLVWLSGKWPGFDSLEE
jgi:hypothetical protein